MADLDIVVRSFREALPGDTVASFAARISAGLGPFGVSDRVMVGLAGALEAGIPPILGGVAGWLNANPQAEEEGEIR